MPPSSPLEALTDQLAQVSDVYARRHGIRRDDDWYVLKLQEEVGEAVQAYLGLTGRQRAPRETAQEKMRLGDELADCLGQVLLIARRHGIDMDSAVERKWLAHLDNDC